MSEALQARYFISYTGANLPLKLVNELETTENRMTYFIGYFNDKQQLVLVEKMVYSEIEFTHRYEYHENNVISKAIVMEDDEERELLFDSEGKVIR